MNRPEYLIIHHEASPVITTAHRFSLVNIYHKQRFNFISSLGYYVGYQYFIEKDGTVKQARADTDEGAHTIGYNKKSIGICLAGNFSLELPSVKQRDALRSLLQGKVNEYHIPFQNVGPHRMFGSTTCYGLKLSDNWAKNLLVENQRITILTKLRDLYAQLLELLKGRKA